MQFSILKRVVMAVLGGLVMSQASSVLADNQSGSFTTGLAAGVDFYQITCFDDGNGAPSYVEAQVKALQDDIAALQQKLAAADEAEIAGIEAELAQKLAAIDALQA